MSEALRQAAKDYLVRYGGDSFPNLFRSAKGTIVTDSDGREYLDFTSGQMCATIGHNHPAIVEAVNRAGQKAFHMFSGMIPEVVVELAQNLARDWLPGDLERTIFINTGSEATEVIAELGLAITLEATIDEIEETIHAHPTQSEGVREAVEVAAGHAIHI